MANARGVLSAAALFGAVVAFAVPGHADQRFNNRDLRGTWGFKAHGFLLVSPESHLPASAVGLNTYDGNGGCSSKARLNAGGTVVALTSSSCSYTVNADGTATQDTVYPGGGAFTTHIVLVDDDEAFFIVSDAAQPGTTVASGLLKRQK